MAARPGDLFSGRGSAFHSANERGPSPVHAAEPGITVDYPLDGSIFPPAFMPPTFLWRQCDAAAKTWRIDVAFADGSQSIHIASQGEGMLIGEIDQRCVTTANKPPFLTPGTGRRAHLAARPGNMGGDQAALSEASGHGGVHGPGFCRPPGWSGPGQLHHFKRPGRCAHFYRGVPMSPSKGAKHVVQPLEPSMMYLINWRVRDIGKPESRVVMHDLPTCANCHSFSADGKTMGIDVDGPNNDKGLYIDSPAVHLYRVMDAAADLQKKGNTDAALI